MDNAPHMEEFGSYYEKDSVEIGLKSGKFLEGVLRISPKNFLDAYVNLKDGSSDVYIEGILNRNAALDGDLVAVNLLDTVHWKKMSLDAIDFLTGNVGYADLFLKTCHASLYDQWKIDKLEVAESVPNNTNCCEGPVDSAGNEGERNIPVATSNYESMETTVNLDQLTANLQSVAISASTDDSKAISLAPQVQNIDIIHMKDIHEKIVSQAKEQCKLKNLPDVTTDYMINTTIDKCAEEYLAYTKTIKPGEDKREHSLANYTLMQLIIMNNLLSVENMFRYEKLRKYVRRSGKIVYIKERLHSRQAVGLLSIPPGMQFGTNALFSPVDSRIPRMKIPRRCFPPDLGYDKEMKDTLFLTEITKWETPQFATGNVLRALGKQHTFEVEKKALLMEHSVYDKKFTKNEEKSIPPADYEISEEELAIRKDLRKKCIFTIDPVTAKDLDDAVSCKTMKNGRYEVGVHIADVTHFLEKGSDLDKAAAHRSTTVYLTEKIVPMLPTKLCENLCSLDAGKDRLCFSIIWEISSSGKVVSEWFGKSIINSCCKLSYDHAQTMIDKKEKLEEEDFPCIYNNHKLSYIQNVIRSLNKIAAVLRTKRKKKGSLRLDQVKYCAVLNAKSKEVDGIRFDNKQESNELIEEYMILANIRVAQKIFLHFPKLSVLRQHPRPHVNALQFTCKILKDHGVTLDITSAGNLSTSLERYKGTDEDSNAKYAAIVHLCSKTMQNANYFCSGLEKKEHFLHYALNESFYTHFTSPIRRYPDIMVHRLLASAIYPEIYPLTNDDPSVIEKQTIHSNYQKKRSKQVQDADAELHLAQYVQQFGSQVEKGIVVGVFDKSFDVLLLDYALVKRCYCNLLPIKKFTYSDHIKPGTLDLICDNNNFDIEKKISLLTLVIVKLKTDKLKLKITLIPE